MQYEASLCNFCNYRMGARQSRSMYSVMGGSGAPTPRPAAPALAFPALHGALLPLSLVLDPALALNNGSSETLALAFWPLPKSPPHAATSPSDAVGQRGDCPRWLPHSPLPPACHLCRARLLIANLLARPAGPTSRINPWSHSSPPLP